MKKKIKKQDFVITKLEYAVKDSGQRRKYETGAVRDRHLGKGRCDLLSGTALLELAKYMEACALPVGKYPARNWEKGIPLKDYIDSALRHLFKLLAGYNDEPHGMAAFWNLHGFIHTLEMIKSKQLPESLLEGLPIQVIKNIKKGIK